MTLKLCYPVIGLPPALILSLSGTPNVPINLLKNPLYIIVSLTPFTNKPDSLSELTILVISSISSFEIISVVKPLQRNSSE